MSAATEHARTPVELRTEAASVRSTGTWGARALIVVALLALVFTMVNVQTFAAAGHSWRSFEWWIAWLLDPMASIALGTAILLENLLARYDRREGWLTATVWFTGLATLTMNVWQSVAVGSVSGVMLHSVAPGVLLFLAAATPRARRKLTAIVADLERQAWDIEAAQRAEVEAAARVERAGREAERVAEDARRAEAADLARVEREHQERQLVATLAACRSLTAVLTAPRTGTSPRRPARRTTASPQRRAGSTTPRGGQKHGESPRGGRPVEYPDAVGWAVGELAAGRPAGRHTVAGAFPGLSEYYAKTAAVEAKQQHEQRPRLSAVGN